jgi:hypothetical protein
VTAWAKLSSLGFDGWLGRAFMIQGDSSCADPTMSVAAGIRI